MMVPRHEDAEAASESPAFTPAARVVVPAEIEIAKLADPHEVALGEEGEAIRDGEGGGLRRQDAG